MAAQIDIIRVELSDRGYDIEIGIGNLPRTGDFVTARQRVHHAVVITDENVDMPHADVVAESLKGCGAHVDVLIVEPGEPSKSVAVAETLWENMVDLGADRKTVIVTAGGGMIGDLAGFVAASYARGIPFFQVPTTLLAQVDSSVGGKVGINLPDAKNMVGAFWQPQGVLIDTDVLETLPEREYRTGLAEVVKYGVILDADFFTYLEENIEGLNNRTPSVVRHIIARSCQLKADVVKADERETTGYRSVLNFGHTFGHAIESTSGYDQLLHGEAVSIGMVCAARLAESLARVDATFTARLTRLLIALNLPVVVPELDYEELMAAMQRDKKAEYGKLQFVLPTRIGHVELVGDIHAEQALAALSS